MTAKVKKNDNQVEYDNVGKKWKTKRRLKRGVTTWVGN